MEAAERVGMARPMPTPMKATRHITSQSWVSRPPSRASRRGRWRRAAAAAAGKRDRCGRTPALGATISARSGMIVTPGGAQLV